MEKVPPPWEGYAPVERAWAWRCIFPFEECKGNIRESSTRFGWLPWRTLVAFDPPDHRVAEQGDTVKQDTTQPREGLILEIMVARQGLLY